MSKLLLRSQSGMVLLLCLIFLTALTLLGLSASADTVLQIQLASNLQDKERAMQSAQATLAWAEDWLATLSGPVPDTCIAACQGFTTHTAGSLVPHPEQQDLSWWRTNGFEGGIDPKTGLRLASIGASGIDPPLWVIEAIHDIPAAENASAHQVWYRLLARGTGSAETTVSVLESVITKSWPLGDAVDEPNDGPKDVLVHGRVSWRKLR